VRPPPAALPDRIFSQRVWHRRLCHTLAHLVLLERRLPDPTVFSKELFLDTTRFVSSSADAVAAAGDHRRTGPAGGSYKWPRDVIRPAAAAGCDGHRDIRR